MSRGQIKLGYILNKYRIKANLDINQLADKLSTDPEYIIALEKGNYKAFQNLNQAISIIRRLSYVLGLRYQSLVELYNKEYEYYLYSQQQKITTNKPIINHKKLRFILISSIGVLIVGYLSLQIYQIQYSPAITLTNNDLYQIYDNDQYNLEGVLNRAENLTLNGQKVTIKEDGKFDVLLNLSKGENRIELSVKKDDKILKTIQKTIYRQ